MVEATIRHADMAWPRNASLHRLVRLENNLGVLLHDDGCPASRLELLHSFDLTARLAHIGLGQQRKRTLRDGLVITFEILSTKMISTLRRPFQIEVVLKTSRETRRNERGGM
jgi:hypothetical protein